MRVVVTGATGLVGRQLVRQLQQRGEEIVILSRDARRARAGFDHAVDAFDWQATAEVAPPQAFEGAAAVVHLAGESVVGRWTDAKRRRIVDSRVLGTRHLVAGMKEASNSSIALVSASAIGYYGDRGEDEVREDTPAGNDFLARCAVQWEREALTAAERGHRVVIPRLGIVLAREGGALASMLPAFRFGLGGRLGHGWQWWSWIHVDDLLRLLLTALDHPWQGAYNATAPAPARQADFARALAHQLGRPAALPTPAWALRLLLGGFAVELLSGKKVLPVRATAQGFEFRHRDLSGALASLLGS